MRGKSLSIAVFAGILAGAGIFAAARVETNHPTGTAGLFMVDKLGTHLRFFDPRTFQEQASFEVPPNPHDFVFSADHKFAYVPIYGDGVYGNNPHPGHQIAIVDLAGRKLAGMIDIAPHRAPHGIQIAPDGMLYVTCDLDRQVLVIDPKTRSINATIDNEGTGHWIAILPDASKLYVTNKTDRPFISVLNLKTRKLIGKIPAPGGAEGIAASPDGKTVVAMDHSEPVIIVIDPADDRITARIRLEGQTRGAYKVYYSPDGKKLVTMSLAARVVNIFDAANLRGEQKTLPTGKDPMGVAFSADGKMLLVANHGDGSVSVMDLEKMQVVKSFHAGAGIETLAYY
jgi:DNA-binding beta-propeller fold protein YncE